MNPRSLLQPVYRSGAKVAGLFTRVPEGREYYRMRAPALKLQVRHAMDSGQGATGPNGTMKMDDSARARHGSAPTLDLVCLSHLRWGFVFQRPNHLMARFAERQRVYFVEEPIFEEREKPAIDMTLAQGGVRVCVPRLPHGLDAETVLGLQRQLLDELLATENIALGVLWYYTPMALPWTRHLAASATVFDCMDELSGFHGAPAELGQLESELFARADIVFTGGNSLYEAKRTRHANVHCFPSSVDQGHFEQALRPETTEPPDQASFGRPRIGYFGVIDERLDLELVASIAKARPEWELVMIGPVAKIAPESLPRLPNIHWLGMKSYGELPAYLSGWDVALMPFALNAATRFISPTKTLEYLAAGRPVVSTAVPDVVHPYGDRELVRIADQAGFVPAIEEALNEDPRRRRSAAAAHLAQTSWDQTFRSMAAIINIQSRMAPLHVRQERSCSTI